MLLPCLYPIVVYEVILMSDKAHFHLLGTVNKQNFHYWADSNPQQLHQRPVHSPQVTVWCRVASFGIVAPPPFFFVCGESVDKQSQSHLLSMWRCKGTSCF